MIICFFYFLLGIKDAEREIFVFILFLYFTVHAPLFRLPKGSMYIKDLSFIKFFFVSIISFLYILYFLFLYVYTYSM